MNRRMRRVCAWLSHVDQEEEQEDEEGVCV